uniref:Uncharacterized protein n=1 Tax=Chromera velia CCMP2878 TaxID=1169474 RepID=A0A0G4HE22_9ALVE|eukprot:Cvel_26626.t1-p1 / transcript=Cvel_26626.t1 / gene=Cvel_26626 / organism=Chromera_velia_CCMP2878 / gene_product=hypothetical protein / transcript_product=hypothetical protein / location=Cvel_scaffold3198:6791-13506(+) / protein_length=1524 / sequence_SO=supercontig / SO=protein_coding / is_pseudo=false
MKPHPGPKKMNIFDAFKEEMLKRQDRGEEPSPLIFRGKMLHDQLLERLDGPRRLVLKSLYDVVSDEQCRKRQAAAGNCQLRCRASALDSVLDTTLSGDLFFLFGAAPCAAPRINRKYPRKAIMEAVAVEEQEDDTSEEPAEEELEQPENPPVELTPRTEDWEEVTDGDSPARTNRSHQATPHSSKATPRGYGFRIGPDEAAKDSIEDAETASEKERRARRRARWEAREARLIRKFFVDAEERLRGWTSLCDRLETFSESEKQKVIEAVEKVKKRKRMEVKGGRAKKLLSEPGPLQKGMAAQILRSRCMSSAVRLLKRARQIHPQPPAWRVRPPLIHQDPLNAALDTARLAVLESSMATAHICASAGVSEGLITTGSFRAERQQAAEEENEKEEGEERPVTSSSSSSFPGQGEKTPGGEESVNEITPTSGPASDPLSFSSPPSQLMSPATLPPGASPMSIKDRSSFPNPTDCSPEELRALRDLPEDGSPVSPTDLQSDPQTPMSARQLITQTTGPRPPDPYLDSILSEDPVEVEEKKRTKKVREETLAALKTIRNSFQSADHPPHCMNLEEYATVKPPKRPQVRFRKYRKDLTGTITTTEEEADIWTPIPSWTRHPRPSSRSREPLGSLVLRRAAAPALARLRLRSLRGTSSSSSNRSRRQTASLSHSRADQTRPSTKSEEEGGAEEGQLRASGPHSSLSSSSSPRGNKEETEGGEREEYSPNSTESRLRASGEGEGDGAGVESSSLSPSSTRTSGFFRTFNNAGTSQYPSPLPPVDENSPLNVPLPPAISSRTQPLFFKGSQKKKNKGGLQVNALQEESEKLEGEEGSPVDINSVTSPDGFPFDKRLMKRQQVSLPPPRPTPLSQDSLGRPIVPSGLSFTPPVESQSASPSSVSVARSPRSTFGSPGWHQKDTTREAGLDPQGSMWVAMGGGNRDRDRECDRDVHTWKRPHMPKEQHRRAAAEKLKEKVIKLGIPFNHSGSFHRVFQWAAGRIESMYMVPLFCPPDQKAEPFLPSEYAQFSNRPPALEGFGCPRVYTHTTPRSRHLKDTAKFEPKKDQDRRAYWTPNAKSKEKEAKNRAAQRAKQEKEAMQGTAFPSSLVDAMGLHEDAWMAGSQDQDAVAQAAAQAHAAAAASSQSGSPPPSSNPIGGGHRASMARASVSMSAFMYASPPRRRNTVSKAERERREKAAEEKRSPFIPEPPVTDFSAVSRLPPHAGGGEMDSAWKERRSPLSPLRKSFRAPSPPPGAEERGPDRVHRVDGLRLSGTFFVGRPCDWSWKVQQQSGPSPRSMAREQVPLETAGPGRQVVRSDAGAFVHAQTQMQETAGSSMGFSSSAGPLSEEGRQTGREGMLMQAELNNTSGLGWKPGSRGSSRGVSESASRAASLRASRHCFNLDRSSWEVSKTLEAVSVGSEKFRWKVTGGTDLLPFSASVFPEVGQIVRESPVFEAILQAYEARHWRAMMKSREKAKGPREGPAKGDVLGPTPLEMPGPLDDTEGEVIAETLESPTEKVWGGKGQTDEVWKF